MNERIREPFHTLMWKASIGYNDSWSQVDPEVLEKFAELIVRECVNLFVDQKYMILNPHEPFANERVRALKEHDKDTVRKIKQHFGVEE